MGEAAGTAAAMSLEQRCAPRACDVDRLRRRLTDQGALPGDEVGA